MKKTLLTPLLLMIICFSSFAQAGSEGRGGGDPIASRFSDIAVQVATYIYQNPESFGDLDTKATWRLAHKIQKSLNVSNTKSLVVVTEKRPLDAYGIPKAAVFSLSEQQIWVHRDSWRGFSNEEKVALVSMELLGLSGVEERRYITATNIIAKNTKKIMNFNSNISIKEKFDYPNTDHPMDNFDLEQLGDGGKIKLKKDIFIPPYRKFTTLKRVNADGIIYACEVALFEERSNSQVLRAGSEFEITDAYRQSTRGNQQFTYGEITKGVKIFLPVKESDEFYFVCSIDLPWIGISIGEFKKYMNDIFELILAEPDQF